MSKDYYRIRLSVGEDSGEGTIWPVDDRHIEFLGDWDYLEGRHAPTVVNLGDRNFNEAGIRQAFKEHFDPTFHLAEMAKPALGHAQYHPRIYRQGSGPGTTRTTRLNTIAGPALSLRHLSKPSPQWQRCMYCLPRSSDLDY